MPREKSELPLPGTESSPEPADNCDTCELRSPKLIPGMGIEEERTHQSLLLLLYYPTLVKGGEGGFGLNHISFPLSTGEGTERGQGFLSGKDSAA